MPATTDRVAQWVDAARVEDQVETVATARTCNPIEAARRYVVQQTGIEDAIAGNREENVTSLFIGFTVQ